MAYITIDEQIRMNKEIKLRYVSKVRIEYYNEAEWLTVVGDLSLDKQAVLNK
jgi:hypothetical protein